VPGDLAQDLVLLEQRDGNELAKHRGIQRLDHTPRRFQLE
jgi:hypothetical protein